MNRRGFFGALATLPFWRRVKLVPPSMTYPSAPLLQTCRLYNVEISGLEAWIPATPPDDSTKFFGVMRDIDWRDVGK